MRVRYAERQPRQLVQAVDLVEPQGRPPVLPGTARPFRVIEHHETGATVQAGAAQEVRGRQPGLSGAEDGHLHRVISPHVRYNHVAWRPIPALAATGSRALLHPTKAYHGEDPEERDHA